MSSDEIYLKASLRLSVESRILLDSLAQDSSASFSEISKNADLRPDRDFIGADLRGVDFTDSDLTGFNFTDADLSTSILGNADISLAITKNTKLPALNVPASHPDTFGEGDDSVDTVESTLHHNTSVELDMRNGIPLILKSEEERLGDMYRFAREGDPRYIYEVGTRFENGHGVRKDNSLAVEFYKFAARSGLGKAFVAIKRLTGKEFER